MMDTDTDIINIFVCNTYCERYSNFFRRGGGQNAIYG